MIRRIVAAASTVVAALGVTMALATPADAAGGIRITGVYYDSPGKDTGSNTSLNAEWVRLKNTSGHAITLTGWRLHDRGVDHKYVFPSYRLGAGATVRIHTGRGSRTKQNLYWGLRWYVWNNTGDKAYLNNSHGTRIDTCSWGDGSGYKSC
ncbi:MAG: lamin tail domain-containing protein [Acidothermales bacterium]|nr:lamin tail domain-containing protein [Acidothermales bacterium]